MINQINLSDNQIIFNSNQSEIFNLIFNEDLTIKTDNKYKEFAFFGGFRSGKSFLFQLIAFLIASRHKNLNILYLRNTYKQLNDSVITQLRNDFEKYEQFVYKVGEREAVFETTKSKICFRAFDIDTNILSNEYDAIFVCQAEDIPYELFLQLFGRMSGSKLPKPFLFMEGNPANTYVKNRYKDVSKEKLIKKGIHFIEGTTFENKHNLAPDYIERLLENYPESWINRYVYGGWEQIDEAVFSEYRERDNVIFPIKIKDAQMFKIYQGLDYGWRNPTAILWANVDYDGNIVIFDEWGSPQKTCPEITKEALRHGKYPIIADYSIKRPDRDGRSVWQDLVREGLLLIECNKDELANIVLVNTLFKQKRLSITKNCVNLLGELVKYKWKKIKLGSDGNAKEEPVDKDNHYLDAMLYLIQYIEKRRTDDPKVDAYKKTLAYAAEQQDYDTNICY